MNSTRINSYDGQSFIEFTPLPDLSSISFELLVSVQGRQVRNGSLALTGAPQFIPALRAVEQSWSGSATLTGTYDFHLTVSALRPSVVWLSFSITDYIAVISHHDMPTMRHILEGGFTVEEAPAQRLFSEFYDLLHQPGNAYPSRARVKTQGWSFWKTKKWFQSLSPKIGMRLSQM